jgi:hypothetical protein
LRSLKITYNENEEIIVPKKNKDKEENKTEIKVSVNE